MHCLLCPWVLGLSAALKLQHHRNQSFPGGACVFRRLDLIRFGAGGNCALLQRGHLQCHQLELKRVERRVSYGCLLAFVWAFLCGLCADACGRRHLWGRAVDLVGAGRRAACHFVRGDGGVVADQS